jgi:hypothetical protein
MHIHATAHKPVAIFASLLDACIRATTLSASPPPSVADMTTRRRSGRLRACVKVCEIRALCELALMQIHIILSFELIAFMQVLHIYYYVSLLCELACRFYNYILSTVPENSLCKLSYMQVIQTYT